MAISGFGVGIRGKLLAVLALPVVVALSAAGILGAQVTASAVRAERVGVLADSAASLSQLTRGLREERWLSVRGPQDGDQQRHQARLAEARDRTDRSWAALQARLRNDGVTALSPQARSAVDGMAAFHQRLRRVRPGVDDGLIDRDLMIDFYTWLLVAHADLPRRIAASLPDKHQAYALVAYSDAQRAIESAATEKLTGELVLVDGRATLRQLRTLSASPAEQEEALGSLREHGGDQLWQQYMDIANAEATIAALGNFRSQFAQSTIMYEAPAMDLETWTVVAGRRVASLEQLAERGSAVAAERSAADAAREKRRAVGVVVVGLLITAGAVVASLLIGSRIVRPLLLLTAAATRIRDRLPRLADDVAAETSPSGTIDGAISGGVDVELAAMLRLGDHDEVGRLAEAITAMNAMTVRVTREHVALRRSLEDLATRSQYQALHDTLTGLPNRALFTDRLQRAVRDGELSGIGPTVLMLDLDGFKQVNDTLGHHCGDLLLIEAGRRMSALLRGDDLVARLGGDEFAVLLPSLQARRRALEVAGRIASAIAQPFPLEGQRADVTVSIGIAGWVPGDGPEDLLRKADSAMYRAKSGGLGAEAMHAGSRVRLSLPYVSTSPW